MFLVNGEMMRGKQPFIGFNASRTAFLKKDDDPQDAIEIIRAPEDVRPLGLKTAITKSFVVCRTVFGDVSCQKNLCGFRGAFALGAKSLVTFVTLIPVVQS